MDDPPRDHAGYLFRPQSCNNNGPSKLQSSSFNRSPSARQKSEKQLTPLPPSERRRGVVRVALTRSNQPCKP
ncbi:hypothetical protein GC56T2_2914 [Geobacillus sp. C56-T2]|nr:hypothetical protein GC56T2_2914 [Geobacillus sp. C56-T2]